MFSAQFWERIVIACATQLWRLLRSVRQLCIMSLKWISCFMLVTLNLGWNCRRMTWLSVTEECSFFVLPLFLISGLLQTWRPLKSVWMSVWAYSSLWETVYLRLKGWAEEFIVPFRRWCRVSSWHNRWNIWWILFWVFALACLWTAGSTVIWNRLSTFNMWPLWTLGAMRMWCWRSWRPSMSFVCGFQWMACHPV